MKEIKAIIQPSHANQVLDALHEIEGLPVEGLPGIMVSEIRCTSRARGRLNPDINTRIELVVPDELVDLVVAAIQANAHTGRPGDGSIFIVDVQRTIRITTGEHNES